MTEEGRRQTLWATILKEGSVKLCGPRAKEEEEEIERCFSFLIRLFAD